MPEPRRTQQLDAYDTWTKLRSKSFGRLAVSMNGQPEIFPVNFLADDSTILIRTEEGAKLACIDANPLVAFEVDDSDPERAWSVVIKGIAGRIDDSEVENASHATLWAWAPRPKGVFIRIIPSEVTGRLFAR